MNHTNCVLERKPSYCNKSDCCDADPIAALVAGYKEMVRAYFDSEKAGLVSTGDCIAGKHNEVYSTAQPIERDSHQYCLSRESICRLSTLFDKDTSYRQAADFETLHRTVSDVFGRLRLQYREENKKPDLGPLHVYDTALRMSHVYYKGEAHDRLAPTDYVYIQAGAFLGAKYLRLITLLCRKEKEIKKRLLELDGKKATREPLSRYLECYINVDIPLVNGGKVPVTCFNCDLQSLGSEHIENFLCVYHRLLEDWAKGYRLYVEGMRKDLEKKREEKKLKPEIKKTTTNNTLINS